MMIGVKNPHTGQKVIIDRNIVPIDKPVDVGIILGQYISHGIVIFIMYGSHIVKYIIIPMFAIKHITVKFNASLYNSNNHNNHNNSNNSNNDRYLLTFSLYKATLNISVYINIPIDDATQNTACILAVILSSLSARVRLTSSSSYSLLVGSD